MKYPEDNNEVKKWQIYNQPMFEKKFLKEHIIAIENGACIDNLINRRASTRLECLRMESNLKHKIHNEAILLKK